MQPLHSLAVLRAQGADAASFLQGQLSQDMRRLNETQALIASINSAQGRVQAVPLLIQRPGEILLVLPTDILESTLARLRKFVLRAKVTLEDGRGHYAVFLDSGASGLPLQHRLDDGRSMVTLHDGAHALVIAPVSALPVTHSVAADAQLTLLNIRAGVPQVWAATQELFVAQMLNLDLLDGISFDKGCYAGQEIIARAHFRGAVKRRMFRLRTQAPPPAPGTRILHEGAHAGDVVASAVGDGNTELLAVLNLANVHQTLILDDASQASLQLATLPYEVPMPVTAEQRQT